MILVDRSECTAMGHAHRRGGVRQAPMTIGVTGVTLGIDLVRLV